MFNKKIRDYNLELRFTEEKKNLNMEKLLNIEKNIAKYKINKKRKGNFEAYVQSNAGASKTNASPRLLIDLKFKKK